MRRRVRPPKLPCSAAAAAVLRCTATIGVTLVRTPSASRPVAGSLPRSRPRRNGIQSTHSSTHNLDPATLACVLEPRSSQQGPGTGKGAPRPSRRERQSLKMTPTAQRSARAGRTTTTSCTTLHAPGAAAILATICARAHRRRLRNRRHRRRRLRNRRHRRHRRRRLRRHRRQRRHFRRRLHRRLRRPRHHRWRLRPTRRSPPCL